VIKALKKTALVSSLTLMSRVLGLIRDALIAVYFGVSFQSDAFFIAFRPFDLVRKMFSEGILNISFIPVFSKILVSEGKSKAASLFFSFFCFLTFAGTLLMLLGMIFSPLIIKMIAPGFDELSYQSQLTTVLFKIMLPYLWLILMSSLCMGVLNSFDNFAVPAFAPVVFNLVVILFTIMITNYFNTPIMGLALGVTIGGVIQLAIQLVFVIRLGLLKTSLLFKLQHGFNSILHPGLIRILKIMIPSMIGAASYQINIMAASFFASKLDAGNVSYLYYADRLVQFPLALFAVSSAMVLLPQFSKKAATGQIDEIAGLFSSAVKLVFFVTIPAMAGLMALDEQIVSLLFGHGAFSASAIMQTSDCLFLLSLGLWAFTGSRLLVTLYYSLSDIKTPFYTGMITIGLNLIFCLILIESLGLQGLVLAVSLSAFIGFFILLFNIPGVVNIEKFEIIVSACRSLFLSAIMYFLVQQAANLILVPDINKFWFGTGVMICIFLGIIFYFIVNILIASPELKLLKKGLKLKQV
jgi:putative peptidoglycan lipid II flippase